MRRFLSLLIIIIATLSITSCDMLMELVPDIGLDADSYEYEDFTSSEKAIFTKYIGETVPFLPTNEYYIEGYSDLNDYEHGINVYTYGNTTDEFIAYRDTLVKNGYKLSKTYADEDGDSWYTYVRGTVNVDLCYYTVDGEYIVDIYVTSDLSISPDDGENEPDDNTPGGDTNTPGGDTNTPGGDTNTPDDTYTPSGYTYSDFTAEEKALFTQYIGVEIPFAPCNEYYVEGYYDVDDYENGMSYYTFGNTSADFTAYRSALVAAGYALDETYEDDYGDTWYCYMKSDVVIDVSYYYYEGDYVIDLYIYSDLSSDNIPGGDDDEEIPGGTGGSTGGGTSTDVDLITNDGKGLPTDSDGVFDVDFTAATNVKDVSDQGYYLDGCPTVGNVPVLIIPVEFSDVTAASRGYTLANINNAFISGTSTHLSVKEYYSVSSYGKLNLDVTVFGEWFRPSKSSSYYADYTVDGEFMGDQLILDEALAYLESRMDLSQFDSDGNNIIDAVVLINTLEIDYDSDFRWAYRYWNTYVDDEGYYYEYDGVSANDYLWASYQFLFEETDSDGNVSFDGTSPTNTYTYIHEFGHVLGADDYYDTSGVGTVLDGLDIMDSMMGDHNPYTKFNYGWLTSSRLVVTDSSVTLTLEDFSKNGDTVIIANNWESTLGAYQEYYVLIYYTNNGINEGDENGYFVRDGVVAYHVNSSLYKEIYEGETYYDVYNNNTDPSDEYGTENNLIELVKSAADTYTYVAGDTMPTTYTDSGEVLGYTFTVDSLDSNYATITITAK